MISRFSTLTPLAIAMLFFAIAAGAQQPNEQKPADKKPVEEKPADKDEKKSEKAQLTIVTKDAAKNATAEQVAESSIFIYGAGGGRVTLNQIRKTAFERGKMSITNSEGKTEQANYQRWTQRAETLDKEKIRLELDLPTARYSMVFNEEKIFGIVDDRSFTPRADAARSFENHIYHGLEALLRYKENESKLDLNGKEKTLGVEYYVLDVTDKQARRTRFFISTKTFRVMILEYEQDGVKFRRRFYDYNYAQGTLVPYLSVLWADDKVIEQTEIGSITFGQRIDDTIFTAG